MMLLHSRSSSSRSLVLAGYALSALAARPPGGAAGARDTASTTMAGTATAGVRGALLKDQRLSSIPSLDACCLGCTPSSRRSSR